MKLISCIRLSLMWKVIVSLFLAVNARSTAAECLDITNTEA